MLGGRSEYGSRMGFGASPDEHVCKIGWIWKFLGHRLAEGVILYAPAEPLIHKWMWANRPFGGFNSPPLYRPRHQCCSLGFLGGGAFHSLIRVGSEERWMGVGPCRVVIPCLLRSGIT